MKDDIRKFVQDTYEDFTSDKHKVLRSSAKLASLKYALNKKWTRRSAVVQNNELKQYMRQEVVVEGETQKPHLNKDLAISMGIKEPVPLTVPEGARTDDFLTSLCRFVNNTALNSMYKLQKLYNSAKVKDTGLDAYLFAGNYDSMQYIEDIKLGLQW